MHSEKNPAGWLVYRCSGSETGTLEELLNSLEHETWTPRTWVSKRLPRRKARETVLLGMLPSYLFVRVGVDLHAMASLGAKHGIWGPMVLRGERVVIADRDLDGLRGFDDRVSQPRRWIELLDPEVAARTPSAHVTPQTHVTSQTHVKEVAPGRHPRSEVNGQILQDAISIGDRVRLIKGPLAPLGIEGDVEEVLKDGRLQLSPFGGRITVGASDVERISR